VRRHGFLRRGPRLPWDERKKEDQSEQVVVKSRKIRVQLPKVVVEEIKPIPIQTVKEIAAVEITVPGLGKAVLAKIDQEEEDDFVLWTI